MGIGDPLATVLAVDEAGDVLHRTRSIEGEECGEIVDRLGLEVGDGAAHAAGFELEDAECLAAGEHVIGLGVPVRQRQRVDFDAFVPADQLDRRVQNGQVCQAEEVHFEQADGRALVHRPLGHGDRLGLIALVDGTAERDVFAERVAGDHDGGGVGAGMPDDAVQALGLSEQLLDIGVAAARVAQLGGLRDCFLEGDVELVRDQPGDAVDIGEAHAERAAGVADGGLRAERAEGDDLSDAVAAVLLGDVANHLVATVVGEVHVDVGHLAALGIEEALEDELVFERVDVGDAEAEEDQAAGGAAADGLGDALAGGELREVHDDQEILGEAGLTHDGEFVVESLLVGRGRVRVALVQAAEGELGEAIVGGFAFAEIGLGEHGGGRTRASRRSARRRAGCW